MSEVCHDNSEILRISTLPTLAQFWLAKRLPRFLNLHPHIQIDIHTSIELVDFSTINTDVAIRLGRGLWPGLRSWQLMDEHIFPICSSEFLRNHGGDISVENLPANLMISVRHRPDDWSHWRKFAGLSSTGSVNAGYIFENSALVLEAARHRVGVAIGRTALVMDDLLSGTLIRLSAHSCQPNDETYWLCCPEAYANKPEIVAFRRWLEVESQLDGFKSAVDTAPLEIAGAINA